MAVITSKEENQLIFLPEGLPKSSCSVVLLNVAAQETFLKYLSRHLQPNVNLVNLGD